MITYTVRFKGGRDQVALAVQKGIAEAIKDRQVLWDAGQAVLEVVHTAFLIKTAGSTDASGLRWPELAPVTVKKKKHDIILVEGGELEQSLEPGQGRKRYQVFRPLRNGVEVGTDRPFAWRQHKGGKRLPQRKLWNDLKKWPGHWWQKVLVPVRLRVAQTILRELRNP